VRAQDFVYNPKVQGMVPPANMGMGIGSGQGPLAGALNPLSGGAEMVMTKAPWAK